MAAPPPTTVPVTTGTTTTAPATTTTTRKARRGESSTGKTCEYLLAVLLPPLAVFFVDGCSAAFLINICLTILGWIPGALHALWSVAQKDPASNIKRRD